MKWKNTVIGFRFFKKNPKQAKVYQKYIEIFVKYHITVHEIGTKLKNISITKSTGKQKLTIQPSYDPNTYIYLADIYLLVLGIGFVKPLIFLKPICAL